MECEQQTNLCCFKLLVFHPDPLTLTKVGGASSGPEILGSSLDGGSRLTLYFMVPFLKEKPLPQAPPQTVL